MESLSFGRVPELIESSHIWIPIAKSLSYLCLFLFGVNSTMVEDLQSLALVHRQVVRGLSFTLVR